MPECEHRTVASSRTHLTEHVDRAEMVNATVLRILIVLYSIVNLADGGFACDTRYHIIGVCLSSFASRPATASVAAVL